jgi:hypothetical protein
VEATVIHRQPEPRTALAGWVLRAQGNLSLVAVALSLFLVASGTAWALPGLWLLLIGHSMVTLGGLSFAPLRPVGLFYQVAGAVALIPQARPLWLFAAVTGAANLWVAWALYRGRSTAQVPSPPR